MGDGRFFFYGFDTKIVEALIRQDFSQLNDLSYESKIETGARISAKIPRRLLGDLEREVIWILQEKNKLRNKFQTTFRSVFRLWYLKSVTRSEGLS